MAAGRYRAQGLGQARTDPGPFDRIPVETRNNQEMLFQTHGLTKSLGCLTAVNNLSIGIERWKIVSVFHYELIVACHND
jgi:hypothetical protein